MLKRAQAEQGVSLIELMIGLAIFAGLLALATPGISVWIQNAQIRTAAEASLNGLQIARATAVQRNAPVNFYLTNDLTNGCALSDIGPDWVVAMDDPTGSCASAPSDTTAPRIVQSRAGKEGSSNVTIVADQTTIGFNGLGRRINAGTAAMVNIDFSNPVSGGTCVADGGERRCLRVTVSAAGQVRLCDPAVASGDSRSC